MSEDLSIRSVAKELLVAALLVLLGLLIWRSVAGSPLDELALIRRAKVTNCVLRETFEKESEDERGGVYLSDVGVYAFTTPDGRDFCTSTEAGIGDLAPRAHVEYLPESPSINRVRGDGCATVKEWFWRKVIVGGVLLAMLLAPGVAMALDGIRDLRRLRRRDREKVTVAMP